MKKIVFSKPKIHKLTKLGYFCADMHYHTIYSDGAAKPEEALKKFNDLVIAITDHNEIKGALESFKIAPLRIIPGIEVKSDEMIDILFYFYKISELEKFYKKEIEPNKKKFLHTTKTIIPVEKLYNLSREYNCLAVAAHPFAYSIRMGIKEIFGKYKDSFDKFEFFEAINGGSTRNQNKNSIEYIKKTNKGFTGGSDGHSIFPLGNVITCAKAKNIKEFLDAIKAKENNVIGIEARLGKIGEYGRFAVNKIKNIFKLRDSK